MMFDVWKNVLAELEAQVSKDRFQVFLAETKLISNDGGNVIVGVKSVFIKAQVEKKFRDLIIKALNNNHIEVKNLDIQVACDTKKKPRAREVVKISDIKPTIATTAPKKRHFSTPISNTTGLLEKFTFDNFVMGTNNELAYSIAQQIIKDPGKKYNPFYLYGEPGLGKTHLVQAIGNEIARLHPEMKILYIPMSHFYNQFISCINSRSTDEFRKQFSSLDVLIIDDIQQLIGKDRSQEEFFDIFNDMHMSGRQIIVTCDRLPSQLEKLDERLTSRLASNGYYDIHMPNFEERCAILRNKAEFEEVDIENEAIEYIANKVNTNIRELQGEYDRIIAMADLRKKTPLEIIKEGYVDISAPRAGSYGQIISPRKLVERVAKYYNLSTDELRSKSRVQNIKNARQVAMYLLSNELSLSTPKIAAEVGVKDHTTVLHGIKKVKDTMRSDFGLRDQINEIHGSLYE